MQSHNHCKAKNRSLVSGQRSASKSCFLNFLQIFGNRFFLPTSEIHYTCTMYMRLFEPDQICHTQNMVAKSGCINQANVHTHYVEKAFKTQHDRIPIDPAILAASGHRFIAFLRRYVQRPETGDFFWGALESQLIFPSEIHFF